MPKLTRQFVPADFDALDPTQIRRQFDRLLALDVGSVAALESLLTHYGELMAVVQEALTRANVEHACHTDDPAVEARFMHTVREVRPILAPLNDQMCRKILDSGHADDLDARWTPTIREWRSDASIFRQENVPLFTACTELATRYDKAIGEMLVDWDGQTLTLQQLAKKESDSDRAVRERAWRANARRRLQDVEAINTTFSELVAQRGEIARNAGEANYRDYAMKQRHRFDYGPAECEAFHEAIRSLCVPLVRELDEARQSALGVESLRPWDHDAPLGDATPLNPFDPDDADQLRTRSIDTVARVAPWMGEHLSELQPGANLDLASRKGKRAGGFQASMPEVGEPFIFMNAAGRSDDVRTMLHEAGHAFHYQLGRAAQPSLFMHHAPIEFCEVASMSMELLTLDHLEPFYADPADAVRAQREQLEGVVRVLPWVAVIDRFQHEIYLNPSEGIAGWTQRWRNITDDFGLRHGGTHVDWSGLEAERDAYWQRQIHLFHYPFYYVEYGIAQLGALQVWKAFLEDPEKATAAYRHALSLGNTRSLSELFAAAGGHFDFSSQTLAPLIELVQERVTALPV